MEAVINSNQVELHSSLLTRGAVFEAVERRPEVGARRWESRKDERVEPRSGRQAQSHSSSHVVKEREGRGTVRWLLGRRKEGREPH